MSNSKKKNSEEDTYEDDLFENFEELLKKYGINRETQHSSDEDKGASGSQENQSGNEIDIYEQNRPMARTSASIQTEQCIKSSIEQASDFANFVWYTLPTLNLDDDLFNDLRSEPELSEENEMKNTSINISRSTLNENDVTNAAEASTSQCMQAQNPVSVPKLCQGKMVLRNKKRDTALQKKTSIKYTKGGKTKKDGNKYLKKEKKGKLGIFLSSKKPKDSGSMKVNKSGNKIVSKAPKKKWSLKSVIKQDKRNSMTSPKLKSLESKNSGHASTVKRNTKTSSYKRKASTTQCLPTQKLSASVQVKNISKIKGKYSDVQKKISSRKYAEHKSAKGKINTSRNVERKSHEVTENVIKLSSRMLRSSNVDKCLTIRRKINKSNKMHSLPPEKSGTISKFKNITVNEKQVKENKVEIMNLRNSKETSRYELRKRKIGNNMNMISKTSERLCTLKSKHQMEKDNSESSIKLQILDPKEKQKIPAKEKKGEIINLRNSKETSRYELRKRKIGNNSNDMISKTSKRPFTLESKHEREKQ